jgi:hypothetical protein
VRIPGSDCVSQRIKPRLGFPAWWAAGVAVLGTAISQVIVGLWEGTSPVGYDSAQDNPVGLVVLIVAPLVAAAAIQLLLQKPSRRVE